MHELLMKVTGMRLKSDFLAKVFVLWSMGNELVPSPLFLLILKIRNPLSSVISIIKLFVVLFLTTTNQ